MHGRTPIRTLSLSAESNRNQVRAAGTRRGRGRPTPYPPSTSRRFPIMANLLSRISAGSQAVDLSFHSHLPCRPPRRPAKPATAVLLAGLSLLGTLIVSAPVKAGISPAGHGVRIIKEADIMVNAICRMFRWQCDPGYPSDSAPQATPEPQSQPAPEAIPTQTSPQSDAPPSPDQAAL